MILGHDLLDQGDYDVLENGVIVGHIFKVPVAPQGGIWMWASGHNGEIRRAAHGDEGCDGGVREELAAGELTTLCDQPRDTRDLTMGVKDEIAKIPVRERIAAAKA